MEDLGRRLKEVRVRAGLTLRELARQADVSPSLDLPDRERQVAAVGRDALHVLPAAQRLGRRAVRGPQPYAASNGAGRRPTPDSHPRIPPTPGNPRSTPTASRWSTPATGRS